MSMRALRVLAVIHYGEYVAAWDPIPYTERPKYHVVRRDGDWVAVLRDDRGTDEPIRPI